MSMRTNLSYFCLGTFVSMLACKGETRDQGAIALKQIAADVAQVKADCSEAALFAKAGARYAWEGRDAARIARDWTERKDYGGALSEKPVSQIDAMLENVDSLVNSGKIPVNDALFLYRWRRYKEEQEAAKQELVPPVVLK